MTKNISGRTPQIRNDLYGRLSQSRGGGQPLSETDRSFMERKFGTNFSGVRVHTGSDAIQMNRELNAQAFTHGRDIYFGAERYSPGTSSGKRLLAHELTHVVQQNSRLTKQNCSEGIVQCSNGARRRAHRFTAEGVSVVARPSCSPAAFGFATVEAATRAALNAIFNTDCIEESRRRRIQRNLTSHGLDIRCRRTTAWCAESTGFFIPANIFTLVSRQPCNVA